jgi:hypothetical protein
MSDDEERYNVFSSFQFSFDEAKSVLKAHAGPQQRYLAKDIFGSDSELSDAPDADGTQFHLDQSHMCHNILFFRGKSSTTLPPDIGTTRGGRGVY